jgi:negative regulator of sigma-B (phosphoserine phosphatase)
MLGRGYSQDGLSASAKEMALNIGCSTRHSKGQMDSGDRCGWWVTSDRIVMAVAVGMGHGPKAAYAAEVSLACIGAGLERSLGDLFAACDARIHDTEGAALAIAIVDIQTGCLTISSVGNIQFGLLTAEREYRFGSTRGILGGSYSELAPESRILRPGDVLAIFTDGVEAFSELRGLLGKSAQSARDEARIVLDRWARPDNDAAVLIYRHAA